MSGKRVMMIGLDGADPFVPVSYTHLDVYKRQLSSLSVKNARLLNAKVP